VRFRECFEYIAGQQTNELTILSAGSSSEMWWDVTHETDRAFYLEASMSLASLFAAGIALGLPDTPVWAFSGDGAFCMNPGMLMVERQMDLPNLKHFLLSNRCYGSTYEVPLPNATSNDYAAMARAMGVARVYHFDALDSLQHDFHAAVQTPGYSFIVLEVEKLGHKLKEPPLEGPEMKYLFGRHIEQTLGVRVFDESPRGE
jgi:thiamine pyrophosphate-dependent acetolactate synthase large subunit-like protein